MKSETVTTPVSSKEELENEVRKLTAEIHKLAPYTEYAGFLSAAVGAILSIPFGPFAFLSGAALGAAAVGSLNVYTLTRRKAIEKEITSSRANQKITEDVATELREELNLVRSNDAERTPSVE
jgi:hypothetical protein